jgi:hypothetical protein
MPIFGIDNIWRLDEPAAFRFHQPRLPTESPRAHRSKTVPPPPRSAHAITRGLQSSWPYRPTALLVSINSPGGSIVQAKDIADLLRLYSNRYK